MRPLQFLIILFPVVICLGQNIEFNEPMSDHEAFSSELLDHYDSLIRELENKINDLDSIVKLNSDELQELQLMFREMHTVSKGKYVRSSWPTVPTLPETTPTVPETSVPETSPTTTKRTSNNLLFQLRPF